MNVVTVAVIRLPPSSGQPLSISERTVFERAESVCHLNFIHTVCFVFYFVVQLCASEHWPYRSTFKEIFLYCLRKRPTGKWIQSNQMIAMFATDFFSHF